jgi:hypothetical protein
MAAFLSSLFPGLGQLYNREWVKAGLMMLLTASLVVAVQGALVAVVSAARAMLPAPLDLGDAAPLTVLQQALPAFAHPTVQARVRRTLVPPILALVGVVLWSMIDAYRRARQQPRPSLDTDLGLPI